MKAGQKNNAMMPPLAGCELFAPFLMLFLSVACAPSHAEELLPKVKAVQQYLLKAGNDYPEVFGEDSYRMKINNAIVADVDDDGEEEVVLHVTPHYLQSPTIMIFRVSKNLHVKRVIEGLAPGPLRPTSMDFLDSHTLGAGVDLTLGKDQANPAKRKAFIRATLKEMGGVVEYRNFIHMDGRKGRGMYIDMSGLDKPPTESTCESFEFSMPDAVTVLKEDDGSGNYLLAMVGDKIYAYKIHKISSDGFLEKTLKILPAN